MVGSKMRTQWKIAIASGWESEGPGIKPRRLQPTFDPGLPKKYYQPYCVLLVIDFFARCT